MPALQRGGVISNAAATSNNYAVQTKPIPFMLTGSATIAGSAPAGTAVFASLIGDPSQPSVAVTTLSAPPDETWLISDIYSPVQSPAIDGVFQFKVNLKDQNMVFGPLSQTYRNVFGYISLKDVGPITIPPNGTAQIKFITSTANSSTTAVTVSFNVNITRIPAGYSGNIPL